jgi:hypothetical protein
MKRIILLFLLLPIISFAALIPFGGPILFTFFCPCNGALMLFINKYYRVSPGLPPTLIEPGTYLFQPVYSQLIVGALLPGKQSLGLASPGGACLIFTPFGCFAIPTMYTIFYIGTNVIP